MYPKRKRSKSNNNSSRWSIEKPATVSELREMGVSVLPNNDQENEISERYQRSTDTSCSSDSLGHRSPNNHSLQCVENVMVTPPEQKSSIIKKRINQQHNGDDAFSLLSDEIVLMIFQWLPKRFLVDCAHVCQRWKRISYDEALWYRIDLTSRKLSSDCLAYVLQRNPHILRMALTDVTSPVFQEMVPAMEDFSCRIQYLDLSMAIIESADLAELLGKCHDLRKLSLEHCTTNIAVCSSIANNSSLEVLNMSQCYLLDSLGLEDILLNCSELTELNLAWTGLDTECVDIVCKLVNEGIKQLNLSGCIKAIKDTHVNELVSRCSCLTVLDLSDCTDLTEKCLDPIVSHLCDLKELSLSRCYSIYPIKYIKLGKMKSLQYLNIFGLFQEKQIESLQITLTNMEINKHKFTTIARPTVGIRRTSVWGLRVRD